MSSSLHCDVVSKAPLPGAAKTHTTRCGSHLRWRSGCLILLMLMSGISAAEAHKPTGEASGPAGDWYVFIAAVNVYPRLESERLIKRWFEPILKGLAPGHDGVYTVSDLRDDHGLWPPHVGLGYNINTRLSVFIEGGYTAGKVRTKRADRSRLLVPLHTDFEIKRSALFGGIGVDYFPWGMAPQDNYRGIRARLAAARPFCGTRLTWTRATFRAKAKLGFRPLPNFLNLELSDAWTLPSVTTVAGVDIPLSRDTALTVNVAYNYFWERDFDFEGWALTIQWKRYFGGPKNVVDPEGFT